MVQEKGVELKVRISREVKFRSQRISLVKLSGVWKSKIGRFSKNFFVEITL